MSTRRQREAECAAEHCIRERWGVVHAVRAVQTQWQRQDLFASDVLGKTATGQWVACQVTTGSSANVAQRRRKLEAIPWGTTDCVLLFEYRDTKEGRRKNHWFRVHEFFPVGVWINGEQQPASGGQWTVRPDYIEIPREWFKAWRPKE